MHKKTWILSTIVLISNCSLNENNNQIEAVNYKFYGKNYFIHQELTDALNRKNIRLVSSCNNVDKCAKIKINKSSLNSYTSIMLENAKEQEQTLRLSVSYEIEINGKTESKKIIQEGSRVNKESDNIGKIKTRKIIKINLAKKASEELIRKMQKEYRSSIKK